MAMAAAAWLRWSNWLLDLSFVCLLSISFWRVFVILPITLCILILILCAPPCLYILCITCVFFFACMAFLFSFSFSVKLYLRVPTCKIHYSWWAKCHWNWLWWNFQVLVWELKSVMEWDPCNGAFLPFSNLDRELRRISISLWFL